MREFASYTEAGDRRRKAQIGRPYQEVKNAAVVKLWESHHEIARLLVLGWKTKDIAQHLGITVESVNLVRQSPMVQDKITIMEAVRDCECQDLAKEISTLAPIALKRIKEAVTNGVVLGKELSGKEILNQANSLLDREMGKAVQRVDSRNLNAVITAEDIEEIKARARELSGFQSVSDPLS